MRKSQKVPICIMVVVLTAIGCSGGSTGTKAPAGPAKTEAAGETKAQAASGEMAGEEDPVLVTYTARSRALNNAAILEFEKDTSIKVEIVVIGTGGLLKRVQSEKDNPLGDISWVADQTMLSASKDLFMEYVSSEDGSMLEAFRNITGYFMPAFVDPTVMIMNKDLRGDIKTDGLEDLLNPELKGKVTFSDPISPSSVPQSLLATPYGMGEDGDPPSGQAWDYMDQFIANLGGKMYNSFSQVYKGVVEGEYVVGPAWEDPAANYAKEGAAAEAVFPEKRAIFPGESVWILKDCKHLENARRFADYMLSEKIQSAAGSSLTVRPLRKDTKLIGRMTPQPEIKLFDNYDERWVAEHKIEITNLFSEYMEIFID